MKNNLYMIEEKKYFILPATIIFILIILTICLFIADLYLYLSALIFTLFICFFENLKILKRNLFFLITSGILLLIFLKVIPKSMMAGAFIPIFAILIKFSPVLFMANLLSSFSSSELMDTIFKIFKSKNLAIASSIFFRFFPELWQRLKEISEGANARGIHFNLFRPIYSFEIFLLPLIFRVISLSDSVYCAAAIKGIESDVERTSYRNMEVTYRDIISIIFIVILLGVSLCKKF